MSFPNIPDFSLDTDITREEAVNLLLASIALEELGLAKILNAEGEKVETVVELKKIKPDLLSGLVDINKSVERTLQDIIKLQMLLQFKLENVIDLAPLSTTTSSSSSTTTSTTSSTSTSSTSSSTSSTTSSTTTSSTTTSTTSTSTTTTRHCKCSLTGCAKNTLVNIKDPFYKGISFFEAWICPNSTDCTNNSLLYIVQKMSDQDIKTELLYAFPETITFDCLLPHQALPTPLRPNVFIVRGKGAAVREDLCSGLTENTAGFTFYVIDRGPDRRTGYRMLITSPDKSLDYDSDFCTVLSGKLTIGICP